MTSQLKVVADDSTGSVHVWASLTWLKEAFVLISRSIVDSYRDRVTHLLQILQSDTD